MNSQFKNKTILNKYGLRFCSNIEHAKNLIIQVLRQDVRGVKQGRGASMESNALTAASEYMCRLDTMDIRFVTQGENIVVKTIIPIS